jgi:hypothetical protein
MSSSAARIPVEPLAVDAAFTDDALRVRLADGREVSAPLEWFPVLRGATDAQRRNWRLIGGGVGLHWPDLDEDISVAGLLATR